MRITMAKMLTIVIYDSRDVQTKFIANKPLEL